MLARKVIGNSIAFIGDLMHPPAFRLHFLNDLARKKVLTLLVRENYEN